MKRCFLCNAWGHTEKHHIFGGRANRKLSGRYGLTVDLCLCCHRTSPDAVHGKNGAANAQKLHEYGQKKFMQENNTDIAGFVKVFGKNYLDMEW